MNKLNICITVGHSQLKNGNYTCADGRSKGGVLEYVWCKNFSEDLQEALKAKGHKVTRIVCPEKEFSNKNQEMTYKLVQKGLNHKKYDLIIELHLNASDDGKAEGCECLYVSPRGKDYATKICRGLSKTFKNRGTKKRTNLYMLNGTESPCVIAECFFCSNKNDYLKGKGVNRSKIARDVAESLSK